MLPGVSQPDRGALGCLLRFVVHSERPLKNVIRVVSVVQPSVPHHLPFKSVPHAVHLPGGEIQLVPGAAYVAE
jgi:hypothetical protein